MPERHTKLLEIDVARLGSGSVVEASCRLLPDKDVSDLRSDSGVDFTDPICDHNGREAAAPDFRNLVDYNFGFVVPPVPTLLG